MRKISRLMAMLFLCVASLLLPTACGAKIEKGVVQPGTYATTVAKGTQYDVSGIVVEFTYSDDEKVTVTADELEFELPDTTQVSDNAKLTIKYDGYSFDVKIRVVATEADVNSVSSFTSWSNNIYKENTTQNTAGFYNHTYNSTLDLEEGDNEKYLGIEPRYVGTDNPFVLDLTMAGYDGAGDFIPEVKGVRTNIKVALVEGTTETELTETTTPKLSDMVTFDTVDAKFQFKTAAERRTFKVTVEPANKEVGTQTIMKVEAILKITNGFNVHNAQELSVYDNSGRDYNWDGVADWDSIKNPILTAAGLPLTYVPSKILIQNDIEITAEDVPTTMFWSNSDDKHDFEEYDKNSNYDANSDHYALLAAKVGGKDENGNNITLAGSMVDRDHTGVYHYNFDNTNAQLEVVGNYFNISAAKFPRAVVEGSGDKAAGDNDDQEPVENTWVNTSEQGYSYMTSHSTLFCHTFYLRDGEGRLSRVNANMTKPTSVSWKNLDFTGNGSATDEAQYSGSIILFKSYRVNSDIYNCVSNYFAINYLMSSGDNENSATMTGHAYNGEFRIDYCKGYNAYQALLFAHGAKHMVVSNSEFIKSSGPAIITVFRDYEDYREYLETAGFNYNNYIKQGEDYKEEYDYTNFLNGGNWDEYDFYPTKLDIINTKVESYVSGKEPWFMINAASMDLEFLLGMLEGYLDGTFNDDLKAQGIASNRTIYSPEKSTSTKKLLNAKVANIMDGMVDKGAVYTVPALGYAREFASMAEYKAFYDNPSNEPNGLELDNHINQNLVEAMQEVLGGTLEAKKAPLYMADNMGSFIGTNNYGSGPSETNGLGNALYMLGAAAQGYGSLEDAAEEYMNAFAEGADTSEGADRFYLYTPACISVIIDLYDRPTAQA